MKSIDFEFSKLYPNYNKKALCVFCSSSEQIDVKYKLEASQLGEMIAKRGYDLVHGGGKVGLMGVIASKVQENGGKVTGILPESLNLEGIASETDDEIIITKDMPDRKAEMRKRSQAFIILPGGFGTLEELFETITLKQLKYIQKPIVLLNVHHYFDELISFIDKAVELRFISDKDRQLIFITESCEEALNYIEKHLKV
ncbi:MAG TPA: TIGR00730 family Rossman fold protein [Bacteroidales bacterium]|jgi:uncharacterized protein (TIGR00730 family)|nr:TIGR00730 family Rossman fold protein [Bacteroidales bacterium]HNV96288.1 TIGR00730 family Rossman fold protein [Bacteroidales bacterium]HOU98449.1 TIGR00730 family Rossman fold protein [Bacteroidales bacterium]